MKRLSGWMRIAIIISIIWFAVCFISGLSEGEIAGSLLGGIIPILVVWVAVWWIVKGFKSKKADKGDDSKTDMYSVTKELRDLEAKVEKIESEIFRYRNLK